MTALGIALTVTTAIFLMALVAGLNRAFVSSGNPLNVLVLRKGSEAELSGGFDASLYPTLKTLSGHRQRQQGRADDLGRVGRRDRPSAQRRHGRSQRNGAGNDARWPGNAAQRETRRRTMVPDRTARSRGQQIDSGRFSHANIGDTMEFGKGSWKVVGVFDAGGSAYESEVWGDVNQMASDFDRAGRILVGVPARDRSDLRRRAQESRQRRPAAQARRCAGD